jgi:hypothetical protein
MIELNNGIGDGVENGIELGVDGFCKRSLNVGEVTGGHDVPSITLCYNIPSGMSRPVTFNWAKTWSLCNTTFLDPSSLFVHIFNSFNAFQK